GPSPPLAPRPPPTSLAEGVEVYPESILLDGKEYTAVSPGYITNLWLADTTVSTASAAAPVLTSYSRIADALWLREAEQRPILTASTEEIYLSGALLAPAEAMETLRDLAPDGVAGDQLFPEISSNLAWTAAAWEVYCATGSTTWLKEAYGIARRTLAKRLPVLKSPYGGLLYSAPAYLYPLSPGSANYPAWMGAVDVYQSLSLGINTWHYATLQALSLMARELSLPEAERYAKEAATLRESINDTFWVPQHSRYGAYCYGSLYPLLFPAADNMANPLCVILGIATTEMGQRAVASRLSLPKGFPTLYPLPAGADLKYSAPVQALQVIAAARVKDEEQVLSALGPLWAAVLNENVTSSSWTAAMLRGLLGITLSADRLSFAPMLPAHFRDGVSLRGLPWREAVLDINLRGAGSKIISFSVDSVNQSSPTLPADLTGTHTIDITLSGSLTPRAATCHSAQPQGGNNDTGAPLRAPVTPRLQWTNATNCEILNFDPDDSYNLYLNGVLTTIVDSRSISVSDISTIVTALTATDGTVESFTPRPHVSAPADACITIPATAITPRRPPLNLIRDRATADRYIELAARHNTRLTFYVNSPASADYFLSIDYTNGTDNTALRTVEVNGTHAGVLVCPSVTPNNWVKPHPSSVVRVSLNEGVNKISLTYLSTTVLLHRINLLRR
ncbi:MAG: hypothetical protein K2K72_05625, partial [Duncaniella sp.]|nr:hypothetical protein [Duncaniella sp.]